MEAVIFLCAAIMFFVFGLCTFLEGVFQSRLTATDLALLIVGSALLATSAVMLAGP